MSRIGVAMRILAAGLALASVGPVAEAQRNGPTASPTGVQQPTLPQTTPSPSITMGADDAVIERSAKIEREQEKARNSDRQQRLVSDTERLLALATELKSEVDKTNKDMLSVDVIRKADEIEKLAHSVKEKMKGS